MSVAERIAAAVAGGGAPRLLLLGHPVAHSLSPRLHRAALAHHGLPGRYAAVECRPEELTAALAAARQSGVTGFNLTAPLKAAVLPLLDAVHGEAAAAGAVNTVKLSATGAEGWNTDIAGFAGALAALGCRPARCLVLGAGGAARAVLLALRATAPATLHILARRPEAARRLVAELGLEESRVWERPEDCPQEIDLVVNATPLGLGAAASGTAWREATRGFEGLPWGAWREGRPLVFDLNYAPAQTALLALAERASCPGTNGLDMLARQAVESFRIWTGRETPLGVMGRNLPAREQREPVGG